MKVLRTSGIIEGSKRDLIPFISNFSGFWDICNWKSLTGFLDFVARFCRNFLDFAQSVRRFFE